MIYALWGLKRPQKTLLGLIHRSLNIQSDTLYSNGINCPPHPPSHKGWMFHW